ncbi:hypothetical protein J3R30DRAFT_3400469 [Lentinula aciculospora]|uniref:TERF2-interacting telomeric protein 1 Myb domain-containing protein n=1 Tax=Lentinula aciculospora TaxID=153920 RepID=A0A9W9DW58_9AGAR|nr:hypothetical protein J3R30DRAFT_3400469 [Lentinula aciculospora]
MQLRLSFVLLGIAAAAFSRPIVLPSSSVDIFSTSASRTSPTSSNTASVSASGFGAQQTSNSFLEERDFLDVNVREIHPSSSSTYASTQESPSAKTVSTSPGSSLPSPVTTRAVPFSRRSHDPSSEIEERYEHVPRSSVESRDVFGWLGEQVGKLYRNPGLREIGDGVKDLGKQVGQKAKEEGQKARTGFQGTGGGSQTPQRREAEAVDPGIQAQVQDNGLVKGITSVVTTEEKTKQRMQLGAQKIIGVVESPFRLLGNKLEGVKGQIGSGARRMTDTVKNGANTVGGVATGAWNGAKNAAQNPAPAPAPVRYARNSFSKEDDQLLVEYLAHFPATDGRKGNRIYKQLTENATGQWSWSNRHPWQSWRHRYMREVDDMDRRIRVFKRRRARAAAKSQLAPEDMKQEEQSNSIINSQILKRKHTPAVESGKQVKRLKNDSPKIGFVKVSQIVRRRPAVDEDKGEGSSRNVRISITQQPTVIETVKVPQKQPISPRRHKEQSPIYPPPPPSDDYSGQIFEDGSDAGMQLNPNASQDDDDDGIEVNHMLTDPVEPDSDLYTTRPSTSKHSKRRIHSSSSKDNNPVPRASSDGLTTTADSGFFESTPPPQYHIINPPDDIFDNSSDTDRQLRILPPPSKTRPVPKLIEGPFGGARHKHPARRIVSSSSESESESGIKENAVEKKTWPPVRRNKRKLAFTPTPTPKSTPAINIAVPSSLKQLSSRLSGYSESLQPSSSTTKPPSTMSSQKGQAIIEDDLRVDVKREEEEEEPLFTQPAANVQSWKIPSDDDDEGEEEDGSDEEDGKEGQEQYQEMNEPQSTQPLYPELPHSEDEPLFTQISYSRLQSQELHPTSPPSSPPPRDVTTEPPSSFSRRRGSDDNDVYSLPNPNSDPPSLSHTSRTQSQFPNTHHFDIPEIQSQSQSQYHTPNRSPTHLLQPIIHPFDIPDSQHSQHQLSNQPLSSRRTITPQQHHSDSVEQPSVSKETADSVVRAINAFIMEMDRSRRTIERDKRARRKEDWREGSQSSLNDSEELVHSRERIQESVVCARGSPIPMGQKKKQVIGRSRGSGDRKSPRKHNHLITDSNASALHFSDPGDSQSDWEVEEHDVSPDQEREDSSLSLSLSFKNRLGTKSLGNPGPSGFSSRRPLVSAPGSKLKLDTEPNGMADHSTQNLFSVSSSSLLDPGPSTTSNLEKNKGKNRIIEEISVEVDVSNNFNQSEPTQSNSRASSSTSRSRQIDLRQLERAQRRRSSLPLHNTSQVFASYLAVPNPDTATIVSSSSLSPNSLNTPELNRSTHPPHSPLPLSFSDQSRLIEQTILNMSQEYLFPPDYVRRVWKEVGDLNEAAAILGHLRDIAGTLLKKANARRSSGVGTGTEAGIVSGETFRRERSRGVSPAVLAANSSSPAVWNNSLISRNNHQSNSDNHSNHPSTR